VDWSRLRRPCRLATAAAVVMSLPRRPLVLAAALLVGLTPDALSLTGAVNSSALEAAAAVCYWAVLLALIHDNSALSRRAGLLVMAGWQSSLAYRSR
jgi:hypothetical protein